MEQVVWKNKLVVLWIFQILNYIAVLLMGSAAPAASRSNSAMASAAENATAAIAFYFFLVSLLIWATLTLKPSIGRWPNMIVGFFFVFVKGYWLITSFSGNFPKGMFFTEIWGFVAAVLIVWFSWKYPKLDALQNTK